MNNHLLRRLIAHVIAKLTGKRGEVQEFSTIERRRFDRGGTHDVSLPADHLEEYRARFQEAKAKRVRRALSPAPRFDDVYEAALSRMTSEEHSGVPVGSVHISDEVKERLRNYRDVDISG